TCLREPARGAAQAQSAEARFEIDAFGPGGPHEHFTREAIEPTGVVLKSEFVITRESRSLSVFEKTKARVRFQAFRQFRDAQPSLSVPIVEPLQLREKNCRL